jgi:hypothetical protein
METFMKNMILGLSFLFIAASAHAGYSCEGYTLKSDYTGTVDTITYLGETYPAQRTIENVDDDLVDVDSYTAYVPAGEVKITVTTKWLGMSGHRERVDEQIVTGTMTTKILSREMVCP